MHEGFHSSSVHLGRKLFARPRSQGMWSLVAIICEALSCKQTFCDAASMPQLVVSNIAGFRRRRSLSFTRMIASWDYHEKDVHSRARVQWWNMSNWSFSALLRGCFNDFQWWVKGQWCRTRGINVPTYFFHDYLLQLATASSLVEACNGRFLSFTRTSCLRSCSFAISLHDFDLEV